MRSQQARFSFSAGVLSPRLVLRGDAPRYDSALRQAINFIITPQGGAVYRAGTKYIGVPASNNPFRIFQFHQGGDDSDILIEVSAGVTRLWQNDALIADPADPLLPLVLANGYAQDDLEDLYFTNQEHIAIICHPNHPPYYITALADGSIVAEYPLVGFVPPDEPTGFAPLTKYDDLDSPSVAGGDATYTITFPTTDPWVVGNRYTVLYDGQAPLGWINNEPAELVVAWLANQAADENTIRSLLTSNPLLSGAGTTVQMVSVSGTVFEVTILGDNAGRPMQVVPYSGQSPAVLVDQEGVVVGGDEPAWSYPFVVTHNGNYYQCIKPHVPIAGLVPDANEPGVSPGWDVYWIDLGTTEPAWFDYQFPDGNPWTASTLPAGHVYAPWDRGWPSVCQFHQQRLILAAPADATTRIWGSRIGNYRDFTPGTNAQEPFEFSLDTSDTPTIKWMASQLNLMVGTSSGEWNIRAEQSLGPADISAIKQNNARSHKTKPAIIDTEIFYIEQGKTKLRASQYLDTRSGFSSVDVSMLAEHLLYDTIKRLVVQHVPEVLMVMLTDPPGGGGQLRFLSYDKGNEVAAWSEAEMFGDVIDIAGCYRVPISNSPLDRLNANQDGVYLAIQRGGVYVLEHLQYPPRQYLSGLTLAHQNIVHMDSWVSGSVPINPGNQISGLEHLEGYQVGVLLDDAWLDGDHIVANGMLELPVAAQGLNYVVGIVYVGQVKTFEHNQGNPRGVAFGTKRRWNKLFVRVLDSAIPIINGTLPPDRTPGWPMDLSENVREGVRDYQIANVGWNDGAITIRQDRPYPTHVLGVFGEFAAENI